MLEVNDFDAIRISLASPEQIRSWSYGEVTKPETINYRTLKPRLTQISKCLALVCPGKSVQCRNTALVERCERRVYAEVLDHQQLIFGCRTQLVIDEMRQACRGRARQEDLAECIQRADFGIGQDAVRNFFLPRFLRRHLDFATADIKCQQADAGISQKASSSLCHRMPVWNCGRSVSQSSHSGSN